MIKKQSLQLLKKARKIIMNNYYSNVVITYSINNLEAESKTDYIEKLKDQFNELHGIELQDYEIQDIEEIKIEVNNENIYSSKTSF